MRISSVWRGLALALLATTARGQTVAAGARAVVASDTLPVYTAMSASSVVKATLQRGEQLTIGLVLFGDDITWCAVSRTGETRRLGFASCEFLEPDRGPASPAAAKPKPQPITIRDAPPELRTPPPPPVAVVASAPPPPPVVQSA